MCLSRYPGAAPELLELGARLAAAGALAQAERVVVDGTAGWVDVPERTPAGWPVANAAAGVLGLNLRYGPEDGREVAREEGIRLDPVHTCGLPALFTHSGAMMADETGREPLPPAAPSVRAR